jgi:hypothetical protein
VVGGYKYPPTTFIQAIQASHSSHSIQEQIIHSKDTIKAFNPLQAPKSNQVLSDLREGVLCFFVVALVAWLLSSSHSNSSKCFLKLARDT